MIGSTKSTKTQLPDIFLAQIQDGINTGTASKELFSTSQSHIFNKLKKDAYTRKFFVSDNFLAYLDQLTASGNLAYSMIDVL